MPQFDRRNLEHLERRRAAIDVLSIAAVLLAGLLLIAHGLLAPHRVAFFLGLLMTIAGVFAGIVSIAVQVAANGGRQAR